MQLNFDPSKALKGLVDASDKYRRGIELYGKTAALKLEAKAKKDAPWQDDTSLARQTIGGVCGWGGVEEGSASLGGSSSVFVIALAGNMEYSVYLELAHGNREKSTKGAPTNGIHSTKGYKNLSGYFNSSNAPYAVLWPTVNAMQGEILKGWANMLNGVR